VRLVWREHFTTSIIYPARRSRFSALSAFGVRPSRQAPNRRLKPVRNKTSAAVDSEEK
jgi:hypothetical protein